ncbi:MAG: hypothetical protein U0Q55_12095 [Vicinamibacterales bacterium]
MSSPRQSARPVVHLFVGLHKTGSSAIRLMLDFHGSMLDRHGFHLPKAGWTRYINGFWNGGHNNVAWEIGGHHPVLPEFGTLADLTAEIAGLPGHQHIVFSEDLDYANGAQVHRLAGALAAFDVRVVLFLRNQPAWLQSLYTEEHKWFTPEPAGDWFLDRIERDRRLHLDALCIRWAKAFDGRISIRCYEQVRDRVFDAFLECCGASRALRDELNARPLPAVNASPDADTLALIGRLSAAASRLGMRADYFNAVISPAVVTAGAALPGARRRTAMSVDARARLLALMTRVNGALASALDVELGPEYFDLPPDDAPAPSAPVDEDGRLVGVFTALGIRLGTQVRLAAAGPQAAALADSLYPWAPDADMASSARLQALLDQVFGRDADAALYLERTAERRVAFEQRGGHLQALAQFDQAGWKGLIQAVHVDAHLNRASWNNLREGQLRCAGARGDVRLWVRHVPTADGDVTMIEPVGRWGRGER